MTSPTTAPETPTIAEIHTPLACAILERLFAIEDRLPTCSELDALRTTLAEQSRALSALRVEIGQLRVELAAAERARTAALALHLGDPGRDPGRERAVGGPRA